MSILKPRKPRQPLQAINLGHNDDEEELTEVRRRRVSFAGVNKVKEFNSEAESVVICDTPAYDEEFTASSDSSQIVKDLNIHDSTPRAIQANSSVEVLGESDMDITNAGIETPQPIYNVSNRTIDSNRSIPQDSYYSDYDINKDAEISVCDNMELTNVDCPRKMIPHDNHNMTGVKPLFNTSMMHCSVGENKGAIKSVFGPELIASTVRGLNSDIEITRKKSTSFSQSYCPDRSLQSDIQMCSSLMNSSTLKSNHPSGVPMELLTQMTNSQNCVQSPAHKRYRLSNLYQGDMELTEVVKNVSIKHQEPISIASPKTLSLNPEQLSFNKINVQCSISSNNELIKSSFMDCSLVQTPIVERRLSQLSINRNNRTELLTSCPRVEKQKDQSVFDDELEMTNMSMTSVGNTLHPIPQVKMNIKLDESLDRCPNSSTASNDLMNISHLIAEVKTNFQTCKKDSHNKSPVIINPNVLLDDSINKVPSSNELSFNDSKRKLIDLKKDELVGNEKPEIRVEQIFYDENIIAKRYSPNSFPPYNNIDSKPVIEQIPNADLQEKPINFISQRLSQVGFSGNNCDNNCRTDIISGSESANFNHQRSNDEELKSSLNDENLEQKIAGSIVHSKNIRSPDRVTNSSQRTSYISNNSSVFPIEIKNNSKRYSQPQMPENDYLELKTKACRKSSLKSSHDFDSKIIDNSNIPNSHCNSDINISINDSKLAYENFENRDCNKSIGKRISLAPVDSNIPEVNKSTRLNLVEKNTSELKIIDSNKPLQLDLSNYCREIGGDLFEKSNDSLDSCRDEVKDSVSPVSEPCNESNLNFKTAKHDDVEPAGLEVAVGIGDRKLGSDSKIVINKEKTLNQFEKNTSEFKIIDSNKPLQLDLSNYCRAIGGDLFEKSNDSLDSCFDEVKDLVSPVSEPSEESNLNFETAKQDGIESAGLEVAVSIGDRKLGSDSKIMLNQEKTLDQLDRSNLGTIQQDVLEKQAIIEQSIPEICDNKSELCSEILSSSKAECPASVPNELKSDDNNCDDGSKCDLNSVSMNLETMSWDPLIEESQLPEEFHPELEKPLNNVGVNIKVPDCYPLEDENNSFDCQSSDPHANIIEDIKNPIIAENTLVDVHLNIDKVNPIVEESKSFVHLDDTSPTSSSICAVVDKSISISNESKGTTSPECFETSKHHSPKEYSINDTFDCNNELLQENNKNALTDLNKDLSIHKQIVSNHSVNSNNNCEIQNNISSKLEQVMDDPKQSMEVDPLSWNDIIENDSQTKVNIPSFVMSNSFENPLCLSDIRKPGQIFSPLQLHNKHYMERLGYLFVEWTEWKKSFFEHSLVIHIKVPWIKFDLQTPVLEVSVKYSDEIPKIYKSAAGGMEFCLSAIVQKLHETDVLKTFKTLNDSVTISNEILSLSEKILPLFKSLERVMLRHPTFITDGRLEIRISSVVTVVAASIYIDLKNWESLSRSDITMDVHVGSLSLSTVKNMFFALNTGKDKFYKFSCVLEQLIDKKI